MYIELSGGSLSTYYISISRRKDLRKGGATGKHFGKESSSHGLGYGPGLVGP
jgi:hypothetical protein